MSVAPSTSSAASSPDPQIHGGKRSRVVFTDDGEKSVRRHDRD